VRIPLLGLDLRLVPAGESDIGSDAWPASQPVHSVYTEPFYLGLYEVTQRQWSALGVENPSTSKGDNLPVHDVSWQDAVAWIAKLNERTGGRFRLPTEAEWERAAQPATSPLVEHAWYRANSAIAPAAPFRESNAYAPRPVGSKRPNPLGFFDMQGNVAEWCSSLFRPYPWTPAADRESLSAP
ncbi:MAG: SUMF1/EgtB/PvdO family nonheme iron enzyme, partial [Anaerolineae bacterium]|nr:SUMF1/EgtB/PvdO family nonheme iron enzyme [Anaerolineae bacterium]